MRITLAALFAAWLLTSQHAQAQYRTPPPRVSPYLNLLRQGSSPGVNYYDLVKPDLEFRTSIQQLQTQTSVNQQAITGLETNALPTTGHAFGFQNHMSYFNNLSSGGAGSFGLTTASTGFRPTGAPTGGAPKSGKK